MDISCITLSTYIFRLLVRLKTQDTFTVRTAATASQHLSRMNTLAPKGASPKREPTKGCVYPIEQNTGNCAAVREGCICCRTCVRTWSTLSRTVSTVAVAAAAAVANDVNVRSEVGGQRIYGTRYTRYVIHVWVGIAVLVFTTVSTYSCSYCCTWLV